MGHGFLEDVNMLDGTELVVMLKKRYSLCKHSKRVAFQLINGNTPNKCNRLKHVQEKLCPSEVNNLFSAVYCAG